MRPYSLDLRMRIVEASKAGKGTPQQLAERFGVCLATVYNYLQRDRTRKSLAPKRRSPSTRRAINDPKLREIVVELVEHDTHATLAEYCDRLERRCGVRMSDTAMCSLLKMLRYKRKKDGSRYREGARGRPLRA